MDEAIYDVDLSFLDSLEPPLDDQLLDTQALDAALDSSDYATFERWIPDFRRPDRPCDYCQAKGLACYLRRDATDCYACLSLFRECSLNSSTMEATNYARNSSGALFDALHSVTEDVSIEQGSRTTVKYLKSKDESGRNFRNGIRFPQTAVKILREWYAAHQDHPYPTEEEKAHLEDVTGLKPHQIANWLANQRRKSKLTKTRHRRCSSPSAARPSTLAVPIDIVQCDKPWEQQNPLERWQNSPPEHEPAAMDDIVDAIVSGDLQGSASPTASSAQVRSNSSVSKRRGATSTTSAETSRTGSLSTPSSAAQSNPSSGSFGSFSSSLAGKKSRRRKRALPLRQPTNDSRRIFQCSFCTDRFLSKYDWCRHERSLHLALEKFICAPLGPCVVDASGREKCVYCGEDYTTGHEKLHNHDSCEEKGLDSRTFYRKDHLRQHLRLMHGCQLIPAMDSWKHVTATINSRCGFCAQRFTTWQDRVDHLSSHFRAGARMIDWKGCRGFDPAVAAQVTNAMPPYLIGIESLSPDPFSATNEASMREFATTGECDDGELMRDRSPDDLPPKATCWEILTIRLGKFVNESVAKNIVVTDEMLQRQARIILYGDDDQWHQTAADNETWLSLFKKGHGLSYIPRQIGGQGSSVPEDLEWYSDLGVRIPFFVQLEQYNKTQNEEALKEGTGGRARDDSETSMMMLKIYTQLLSEGVLHSSNVHCPHQTCTKNTVECHFMAPDGELRRRQNRWCNDTITTINAQLLAKFIGLAKSGVSVAPVSQLGNDTPNRARAAKARSACLNHLQWNEVECCPFLDQIEVTGRRRDEHVARLEALARGSAQSPYETAANGSQYFPYHQAEMPADKAHHFQTYRQSSDDSGIMGPVISTHGTDNVDLEMLEMVNRISPGNEYPDLTESMPSTGITAYSMLAPHEQMNISLDDVQFDVFDLTMDEL